LWAYTPEGAEIGEWVLRNARGVSSFYDIDTPVTLQALAGGQIDYITNRLLRSYDLYLSFTGGPFLSYLSAKGARMARPLYCSADVSCYFPEDQPYTWDLGYMGTYSVDRAAAVENSRAGTRAASARGPDRYRGTAIPDRFDVAGQCHAVRASTAK
jgi:spore maturation protein CgeB